VAVSLDCRTPAFRTGLFMFTNYRIIEPNNSRRELMQKNDGCSPWSNSLILLHKKMTIFWRQSQECESTCKSCLRDAIC